MYLTKKLQTYLETHPDRHQEIAGAVQARIEEITAYPVLRSRELIRSMVPAPKIVPLTYEEAGNRSEELERLCQGSDLSEPVRLAELEWDDIRRWINTRRIATTQVGARCILFTGDSQSPCALGFNRPLHCLAQPADSLEPEIVLSALYNLSPAKEMSVFISEIDPEAAEQEARIFEEEWNRMIDDPNYSGLEDDED